MQSLIYHFFFLFTISLLICDTVLSQVFRRTNSLLLCAASPLYCPILQILAAQKSQTLICASSAHQDYCSLLRLQVSTQWLEKYPKQKAATMWGLPNDFLSGIILCIV